MSREKQIQPVIDKIQELIPLAPSDWAEIIAAKIGKSVNSVREYARGSKGLRTDGPLLVLENMKILVAERENKIKKITA